MSSGRPRRPGAGAFPAAFTLLEITLVLALLTVIGALAWPLVQRPLETVRLRRAANRVRSEWATAQLASLETSRFYVFRFYPGTSQYKVEPQFLGSENEAAGGVSTNLAAESPVTSSSLFHVDNTVHVDNTLPKASGS